ncbi:uncharacterized protein NECHADRAFT_81941 [Fusarium vanettenii 77-13-4]|uniref:Uncharacterized protein n=1 Tax=Fusarium vanettenii (strain ATCC MYA-4622 / CBS 123669 / FGSC 9596 / NRRL 45880 / 77-13-4) TaxID=660122 RepID=C7ZA16_FUSV7|nr:uncharacterized protein NECHADRAFT_81941 [Fusarium vanettenii 77-13-4]EEU39196.1 predicted protein [Fusarium vanettenii 77-13-4]
MATATQADDISTSWQGRCPGMVFARAIIKTLTSTSSPLLDDRSGGTEEESLQPEEPTSQQIETYNELCQSILDVCKNGPFEERLNADTHPSSEAFVRVPELSELAKISGGTFFIDENTGNICRNRVSSMAHLFLQTCPGDENSGWGPLVQGMLREAIERTPDADELEEIAGMIYFRWELGLLADYMVEAFGLPKPGGEICILWDSRDQRSKVDNYQLHSMIFGRLKRSPSKTFRNLTPTN